jgi:tRNA-splicing ligase RtcB
MKQVINEEGARPIKIWTDEVEDSALQQLKNIARLPFIASNGVACMPDVHAGIGATVGTVIATDKAIVPAAVGVDIGCGMNAVRLSLKATDLPDSLLAIRHQIERDVPLGTGSTLTQRSNSAPLARETTSSNCASTRSKTCGSCCTAARAASAT